MGPRRMVFIAYSVQKQPCLQDGRSVCEKHFMNPTVQEQKEKCAPQLLSLEIREGISLQILVPKKLLLSWIFFKQAWIKLAAVYNCFGTVKSQNKGAHSHW